MPENTETTHNGYTAGWKDRPMLTATPATDDSAAVAAAAAAFTALREQMLADGFRWASSYRGVHHFEKVTGSRFDRREFIYADGAFAEVTRRAR